MVAISKLYVLVRASFYGIRQLSLYLQVVAMIVAAPLALPLLIVSSCARDASTNVVSRNEVQPGKNSTAVSPSVVPVELHEGTTSAIASVDIVGVDDWEGVNSQTQIVRVLAPQRATAYLTIRTNLITAVEVLTDTLDDNSFRNLIHQNLTSLRVANASAIQPESYELLSATIVKELYINSAGSMNEASWEAICHTGTLRTLSAPRGSASTKSISRALSQTKMTSITLLESRMLSSEYANFQVPGCTEELMILGAMECPSATLWESLGKPPNLRHYGITVRSSVRWGEGAIASILDGVPLETMILGGNVHSSDLRRVASCGTVTDCYLLGVANLDEQWFEEISKSTSIKTVVLIACGGVTAQALAKLSKSTVLRNVELHSCVPGVSEKEWKTMYDGSDISFYRSDNGGVFLKAYGMN